MAKPFLGFFWVFDKDPRYKVSEFSEHRKWGFQPYLCSRECRIGGDCTVPLGVDFGRSKLGQTIYGFLWVLVKGLGAEFVAFFKQRKWSFLQFLSSQQCSFLGSAEH